MNFYSHGKLLISGEYLVLDGVLALAVPTKLGQTMRVDETESGGIHWTAYHPGGIWFDAVLDSKTFHIEHSTHPEIASNLSKILLAIRKLKEAFLSEGNNYRVTTHLEFNREWGLGSSSTLLSNLAAWANVNPFELLGLVSKGSGYDIACAGASGPLLYRLENRIPVVQMVSFQPSFKEFLYFVYLGKKQSSDTGISDYRKKQTTSVVTIEKMSSITRAMLCCESLMEFQQLMDEHEAILGGILETPLLKDTLFKGFPGSVKSLGAWGGDFAMIATDIGKTEVINYINTRGMAICFGYNELIISPIDNSYSWEH